MKQILYNCIIVLFLVLFTFCGIISAQEIIINTTWWCLTWVWTDCILINSEHNYTVESIVQDVIFAGTYMVWTVLTLVIIYCWLGYIFAARWWKKVNKYKDWLKKAMIWALLVWWAYAIVRLIQYIANW